MGAAEGFEEAIVHRRCAIGRDPTATNIPAKPADVGAIVPAPEAACCQGDHTLLARCAGGER